MHTIRPNGVRFWDVIFVGDRGADVVFGSLVLAHAMELASYFNGGERPSDAALLSVIAAPVMAKDST